MAGIGNGIGNRNGFHYYKNRNGILEIGMGIGIRNGNFTFINNRILGIGIRKWE